MVIADFPPVLTGCSNPASAGAARLSGVLTCHASDTGTAHPNQARYQLRYTRIFNFCHYTTARGKIKDFSVCGHSCGQKRFYAVFGNRVKSRKHRRRKALRRFAMPRPGYRHGTPKPPVLTTALHPVMPYSNADSDIIQHLPRPCKNKIAWIGASPLHAIFSSILLSRGR